MAEITIPFTGWYEEHKPFEVTFTNGITTIVGKNGSGKSSMIHEMNKWLKENKIPVYLYDQEEAGYRSQNSIFYGGSSRETASYMCSSEGQRHIVSFGGQIGMIKSFFESNKDKKVAVLLTDALDSGLSIDNIRAIQDINRLILKDFPNAIIVNTANNYEFAKDTRCVIANNGKDVLFDKYEDFVKFITMCYKSSKK